MIAHFTKILLACGLVLIFAVLGPVKADNPGYDDSMEHVEDDENSLKTHANNMENKPENEESSNPGEPIIP